jgi:5'-nucleotidase
MRRVDRRHLLPGAAAFAGALVVALLGLSAGADEPAELPPPAPGQVEIQLLGVNDFHGHLEPPQPDIGGAAWLGAWLDRTASSHADRTIRVHAGDMVGASPLISSHFHDEPTIEATNKMGFDVGTLGNHEFDEGGREALRLVRRAHYPYVAANTVTRKTGQPILRPYKIVERAGVKVGFIGVTTEDTPYFLLSEYARQYRWVDISKTVNRYVRELRAQGVETIVVLAHAGAFQQGDDATGEIVDEARQMSRAVDVVVAGHTHSRLNVNVGGKLIVEALSYGVAFDRVRMTVDVASGDVVAKSAEIMTTRHAGISPDPDLLAMVASYGSRVAGLGNRVVGYTNRYLDRHEVDQLAARAQRAYAGADIGIVNPGNTRSDLSAGPITYADAFEAQAYEHPVWRVHLSGSQVRRLLRSQPRLLVAGPRRIRPRATYAVAANGILMKHAPFADAFDKRRVGTDLQALVAYLKRKG